MNDCPLLMKARDFVKEFEFEDFPQQFGRWISFNDHYPPFDMSDLRQMEKMGVIQLEIPNKVYRLTMKASVIRIALDKAREIIRE